MNSVISGNIFLSLHFLVCVGFTLDKALQPFGKHWFILTFVFFAFCIADFSLYLSLKQWTTFIPLTFHSERILRMIFISGLLLAFKQNTTEGIDLLQLKYHWQLWTKSRIKVVALIEKKGSLLTTLVKGSLVSNGFLTCIVTQSFSTLSLLRNCLSLVAGQTGFYAQVVSGVVGFLVCGGTPALSTSTN